MDHTDTAIHSVLCLKLEKSGFTKNQLRLTEALKVLRVVVYFSVIQ